MPICRESPSFQYPIGSVIEDCNAVMKIKKFKQTHSGHAYQVDVLKWNLEPSDDIKKCLDMENFWVLVTAESVKNIILHS